jgi:SAM-dependent methyltransferase
VGRARPGKDLALEAVYPTPIYSASLPSAEQLADQFLSDTEFRALQLGDFFNTPTGEFLAEAVKLVIPDWLEPELRTNQVARYANPPGETVTAATPEWHSPNRVDYTALLPRRCPLCNGQGQSDRTVRRIERAGGIWRIVRCSACGFVFVANPRHDTADHLDAVPEEDPGDRPRYHHVLALLSQHLPEGSKVIEVGSGFGTLGTLLSRRFTYIGLEPAHGIASYAAARGIDVREQLFLPSPEFKSARAIVFDNVLEHVVDPLGLLRTAYACLAADGLVVIVVPNRWDLRQIIPSWRDANHWIPPDHINYFTRRHLAKALQLSGFVSMRGFGTEVLGADDGRFWLRGGLERIHVHPFGFNVWATKP